MSLNYLFLCFDKFKALRRIGVVMGRMDPIECMSTVFLCFLFGGAGILSRHLPLEPHPHSLPLALFGFSYFSDGRSYFLPGAGL
jgi:hypothetical protein